MKWIRPHSSVWTEYRERRDNKLAFSVAKGNVGLKAAISGIIGCYFLKNQHKQWRAYDYEAPRDTSANDIVWGAQTNTDLQMQNHQN